MTPTSRKIKDSDKIVGLYGVCRALPRVGGELVSIMYLSWPEPLRYGVPKIMICTVPKPCGPGYNLVIIYKCRERKWLDIISHFARPRDMISINVELKKAIFCLLPFLFLSLLLTISTE